MTSSTNQKSCCKRICQQIKFIKKFDAARSRKPSGLVFVGRFLTIKENWIIQFSQCAIDYTVMAANQKTSLPCIWIQNDLHRMQGILHPMQFDRFSALKTPSFFVCTTLTVSELSRYRHSPNVTVTRHMTIKRPLGH